MGDADGARAIARLLGRALRSRRLMRAPVLLERLGLGRLLGRRVVVLTHRGRVSGLARQVALETLARPSEEEWVVASGFGARSQWYRNLEAWPHALVSSGRLHRRPVGCELLGPADSRTWLGRYAQQHPRAFARLTSAIEAVGFEASDIRVVRLRLEATARVGTQPQPSVPSTT